jgi:hypothetical protein
MGSMGSPEVDRAKLDKDKPNISVENLKAHKIEYNLLIPEFCAADGTPDGHLPRSIDRVRKFLLSFTSSSFPQYYKDRKDRKEFMEAELSQKRKVWTDEEKNARGSWSLIPPMTAWCNADHPKRDEEIDAENTNKDIDECREIAETAARDYRKASEASWTRFLRNNVFRDFKSTTRPQREYE